jgi:hypothetical protein
MRRIDGEAILFQEETENNANKQREAALDILTKVKNFFNTNDLTEVEDKIDNERLSNDTTGLSDDQAQEVSAYLDGIKTEAERTQEIIDHTNNRSVF